MGEANPIFVGSFRRNWVILFVICLFMMLAFAAYAIRVQPFDWTLVVVGETISVGSATLSGWLAISCRKVDFYE